MYFVAKPIVTNGLIFQVDPANTLSYTSGSNTITSLAGNSITGSVPSAVKYSNDVQGSLVFDGSNSIQTNFKLLDYFNDNDDFTVSIWFNMSSAVNQTAPIGNRAFNNGGWMIYDYYGEMRLYGYSGSATFSVNIVGTGFNPDNTWTNYTYTIQNQTGSVYYNGQFRKTGDTFKYRSLDTPPMWIGSAADALRFSGSIGVTQIYNRALSSSEVQQNFNALKGRYGI